MQRCLYSSFQNQCPHFLLLLYFRRISRPLDQDQKMWNKYTVNFWGVIHFYSYPQAKFSSGSYQLQGRKKLPISLNSIFSKYVFPQQKEGRILELNKTTKINLRRVLVPSFYKFHCLCNIYIFAFFCAII